MRDDDAFKLAAGILILVMSIVVITTKTGCVMEMADPDEMTGRADVVGSLSAQTYLGPEGSGIVTAVCGLPDEVPISGGCFCTDGFPFYFETILDSESGFGCICEPAGDDQASVLCIRTEIVEDVLKADPEKLKARADSFHKLFTERVQKAK